MLTDKAQLAWAAGLFEGEGCFTVSRQGHRPPAVYVYPVARLVSTDEDVVRHFHEVVGVGTFRSVGLHGALAKKPAWEWCAPGFERVQQVAALLWPWLGERRRERAAEILTFRPVGRQV